MWALLSLSAQVQGAVNTVALALAFRFSLVGFFFWQVMLWFTSFLPRHVGDLHRSEKLGWTVPAEAKAEKGVPLESLYDAGPRENERNVLAVLWVPCSRCLVPIKDLPSGRSAGQR